MPPKKKKTVRKKTTSNKITNRQILEEIIRVDHAGEFGATKIYDGQIAIFGKNTKIGKTIQHMADQEQEHIDKFNELILEHRVRPTALLPIWNVAGFALGASTALMGEKAAMACTVAVEKVIGEHYEEQLSLLEDDHKDLKKTISKFRDDELEIEEAAEKVTSGGSPQKMQEGGEVAPKKHDFMLAEEFYRASIQLNPRKASYTYAYAQNLLRQGKSEKGKRQLKQARRLKAEKYSRQAHEWAERKNWQEVCRNLQLAVEVDPTFLNAIEELAYVHAELGNLNQAKSTLSIGLLNVPNWAPGYWERGKIKQRTQEIEGAKLDFQKAIILSFIQYKKTGKTIETIYLSILSVFFIVCFIILNFY